MPSPSRDEPERHRQANLQQVPHFELCRGHRERVTALVAAVAAPGARLCVLGAGNCYDLDLDRLAGLFAEVHLVDLDPAALARAVARVAPALRPRIVPRAPADLSGMLAELDRWRALAVTEEEIRLHPQVTAATIAAGLGEPFDVVVSACLLTQMQLSILEVLGDGHPLYLAARETVNVTHLRVLQRLLVPGGYALVATDVTSSHTYPLGDVDAGQDLRPLFDRLVADENVFQAVHPARWPVMVSQDPVLAQDVRLSRPLDVWLWQNSPTLRFLVYAFALQRRQPPSPPPATVSGVRSWR